MFCPLMIVRFGSIYSKPNGVIYVVGRILKKRQNMSDILTIVKIVGLVVNIINARLLLISKSITIKKWEHQKHLLRK